MRVVRLRIQGKKQDVREVRNVIESVVLERYGTEINWSPEYEDLSKRWSRQPGKPTGKVRIYGVFTLP